MPEYDEHTELMFAAIEGLITADEYLDSRGVPRRPWPPPPREKCTYCELCDTHFGETSAYRKHMRTFHPDISSGATA